MKKSRKLRLAALAALVVSFAFGVSSLSAAPSIGGNKCSNPGSTVRTNNSRYICSPEGGRNIWRRVTDTATISGLTSALRGLSTLDAALVAADLKSTLNGTENLTLFAPTNSAFNSLPPGILEKLLKPENREQLRQLLLHHVVQSRFTTRMMLETQLRTAAGDSITVMARTGWTIDGIQIRFGDIMATNGVIHIVNKVLLPPGFDPANLK